MMNSYAWKSLELDINVLSKKCARYYRVFHNAGIETIRDLLDHTWGGFKAYPGVGEQGQNYLETELRRRFGIDIDEYLASSPPTASVPDWVRQYCFDDSILKKEDLKKLSRAEVMRSALYDLNLAKRMIRMLDTMGIQHLEPGNKIILEAADLPAGIKNRLFEHGFFTTWEVINMPEKEIGKILGPSGIAELRKWRAVQSSGFCIPFFSSSLKSLNY